MNQADDNKMHENLEKLQQMQKHANNSNDPDVKEADAHAIAHRNAFVYKLEDIEYEEVSSTK
jgi:hypothetical protein